MMDYSKVNDFDLRRLDLTLDSGDVVSLLDMFTEINMYQDLFGAPLLFEIMISDGLDLYSTLPIKNNEILDIEFLTPGSETVAKQMLLYSREELFLGENGNSTYYKLKFVSPETIQNLSTKASRSYTGTVSDIVGAIWSDHFKDFPNIQTTPSKNEYTLVLPYDTPFAHFEFLSRKALWAENENHCDFLFFEDFRGFNFTCLGAMMGQPSRGYFRWDLEDASPLSRDSKGGLDLIGSRARMQDVVFLGNENLIDEIGSGMYNGFINQHDIMNKTHKGVKYQYTEAFPNTQHLNEHPLNTKKELEKIGLLASYRTGFAGVFPPDTMIKRRSQIESFMNKRLRFVTAGNSGMNAGDKIKLDFTQQSTLQLDTDGLDKYRSGYYIVSSVKHTINKKDGYKMTVEACTDSYGKPLPTESSFESKQVRGA